MTFSSSIDIYFFVFWNSSFKCSLSWSLRLPCTLELCVWSLIFEFFEKRKYFRKGFSHKMSDKDFHKRLPKLDVSYKVKVLKCL